MPTIAPHAALLLSQEEASDDHGLTIVRGDWAELLRRICLVLSLGELEVG